MGDVVVQFATFAIIIAVAWTMSRIYKTSRQPVADDPQQPYTVFTREFDIACSGREVLGVLSNDFIRNEFSGKTRHVSPETRQELADESYEAARTASEPFASRIAGQRGGVAVAILVDQSGSMADRMPMLAGQLKAAVEVLARSGMAVALLGFTTRGWRGGKAREVWKERGSPPRPGRLCALLHVRYKDFDAPLDPEDWRGMLLADALRENVDGEALQWANELLGQRSEARRLLVIVSDGAPVDDSTLNENGGSYLWNHRQAVVGEIAADDGIVLGGLGIEHKVDSLYPAAGSVERVEETAEQLLQLIERMLDSGPAG